jgi:hypothetical protein
MFTIGTEKLVCHLISVVGNSLFFLLHLSERGEFVNLPRVQNCSFLKRARPKACQAFAKHKQ